MTRFEDRPADWLTPDEALERILSRARPLPPEEVPLAEAGGRALAEAVLASVDLPPWDNSAMDGYAVRGDDLAGAGPGAPVHLEVVGVVKAGADAPARELGAGEAVRVMTGGPVPPGADSVVRVEDTDAEGGRPGRLAVLDDRDRGRNIRPAGRDMKAGEVVLEAGRPVSPAAVGVLASVGRGTVRVPRRPRVAVLTSGDELRGPDGWDDVAAGRAIPDSNGPMLAAAVAAVGAVPRRPGIVRDDQAEVERAVAEAAASDDVVVTVGGASMGEADLFKRVMDRMGYEPVFWRIRMRPGTPTGFGTLPGLEGGPRIPVFGLPGNPASAFVTFHLFVRPFLLRLLGHGRVHPPRIRATAGETLPGRGASTHYPRVVLEPGEERPLARLSGHQSSGLATPGGRADGLAVVREGTDRVAGGDPVDVLLLDGLPGGPWTSIQ